MSDRPFDMPDATHTWEARGGWLVNRLAADFALTREQAAGIVGNLGFESVGFTKLHEIGQAEGVGGYGWAQWTGPRRRTFFAYAEAVGLPWTSDEANYGYLMEELRGTYRPVITALKKTASLSDAVFSVGLTYERPGGTTADHLPGFDGRVDYARRALAGATALTPPPLPDDPNLPRPVDIRALVIMLQQALADQGYEPGPVDGIPGDRTFAALRRWRDRRSA